MKKYQVKQQYKFRFIVTKNSHKEGGNKYRNKH